MAKRWTTIVKEVISESLSQDHMKVIQTLEKPRHDDEIAEDLDVKATIIRTLLNDLHANNMVEYERTKNKATGWYTYLWNKRDDKVDEYIRSYLAEKLENLESKLEAEEGIIFECKCGKSPFEIAMENEFICPDCDDKYAQSDNTELKEKMQSEINEIREILVRK